MLRLIPITDSQIHIYGIYYNKLTAGDFVKDFVSVAQRVFGKLDDIEDIWPAEYREHL